MEKRVEALVSMGHHHHHEVSGTRLAITIVLNILISIAELIGGIISGSMALITDAAHNFSDVLSLIISYIANRLAKRQPTAQHTFGYRRSEILAAFVNSVTLIIIAFLIFYESITRILEPQVIDGMWVIYLAGGSVVLNGLSVLLIKKDATDNMNMRSAMLHLFSDMITSVGVLIGGLIIKFYQWYYIDTIFSIAIACYLLYMSWAIFRDSLRILMQFTPKLVDVEIVSAEITKLAGVSNLHHVHCWQLNDHDFIFEAHIDLTENISISEFDNKLIIVKEILAKHGINHSNIQPEYNVQDNKDLIHPKHQE